MGAFSSGGASSAGASGAAAAGCRTGSGVGSVAHCRRPTGCEGNRMGWAGRRSAGEESSRLLWRGHSGVWIELFSNNQSLVESHVFHGGGVPEVKALAVLQLRKACLQV